MLLASALAAACAQTGAQDGGRRAGEGAPVGQAPIVTTERGPRGGYLVFVDVDGTRTADLTRTPGADLVLDRSPAFSPDGRWIAFASTRHRDTLAETSLWIVPAQPGAEPRPLTSGPAVDRDPAWMPDGQTIIYASNRGGSFDLYALRLSRRGDGLEAAGEPRRLTGSSASALAPSVSPDGRQVVYMVVDEEEETMTLRLLDLETGRDTRLTEGPMDMTPAWSPRGDVIAFASLPEDRPDVDLFVIEPQGGERRAVAEEPLSDQTGPAFSADGRYLFATSVYRSVATGDPILSSVVVVDLDDADGVVRALHDPVVVESRVGVTIGPHALEEAALRDNPPYADALRDAVARELRREQREREQEELEP